MPAWHDCARTENLAKELGMLPEAYLHVPLPMLPKGQVAKLEQHRGITISACCKELPMGLFVIASRDGKKSGWMTISMGAGRGALGRCLRFTNTHRGSQRFARILTLGLEKQVAFQAESRRARRQQGGHRGGYESTFVIAAPNCCVAAYRVTLLCGGGAHFAPHLRAHEP